MFPSGEAGTAKWPPIAQIPSPWPASSNARAASRLYLHFVGDDGRRVEAGSQAVQQHHPMSEQFLGRGDVLGEHGRVDHCVDLPVQQGVDQGRLGGAVAMRPL